MKNLNAALRILFALVCAALSLAPLWRASYLTMMFMSDPSHAPPWKPVLFLFVLGGFFAWRAYVLAKSAYQISTTEKAATASSTAALALGAALLLGLGSVVYRQFFMFVPGQGMFRAAMGRQTLGHLGAIRSSLSIYYGDMEGQYPADLKAMVGSRWALEKLPLADTGMHPPSDAVQLMTGQERAEGKFRDDGGWFYVTDGPSAGKVGVNCVHTDVKGSSWIGY